METETVVHAHDFGHGGHAASPVPVPVGVPPVLSGRRRRHSEAAWALDRTGRRAVDIVASAGLLLVLSPVILLTAIAIRLDSRGPVFYRAPRAGRGGPLRMLKFRKMTHDAAGMALTVGRDQRFTRVGRFLARSKLDELPQLWHVLRGQMSLVGPRPEDPGFVSMFEREFEDILTVRPGVTGFSQLAFAEESHILDSENPVDHYVDRILPQKLAMDRLYASEQSLALNIRILAWTCAAVLMRRSVSVHRESGRMRLRVRN